MLPKQISGVIGCALAALLLVPGAWAGPFITKGPFKIPLPGVGIPTPDRVPGKEYTDFLDKDDGAPPALTPLQNLAWDGGGGRANSFNLTGTGILGTEIDATANSGDALFHSVIANTSALLVSATGDPIVPILVEPIAGCGGGACPVWATVAQVDQEGVTDLDALEVWGGDGPGNDDSNRVSTLGDPGGVAVWACASPLGVGVCTPFVTSVEIAVAIGLPTDLIQQLDLDALMTSGEELLFSIRPVGPFDGGEIWHWDRAAGGPATFLAHGGPKFDCRGAPTGSNLWDTSNCVTRLLGNENVDALEAVSMPEPTSLALLGIGLLGLAPLARRRRRL